MDIDELLAPEHRFDHLVSGNEIGRRLDHVLADACPWVSRSCLVGWIKSGRFTIDDVPVVRPAVLLQRSARIRAMLPKRRRDLDLDFDDLLAVPVIGRFDDWLVVDKPAGVPCHPSAGHVKRTLVSALAVAWRDVCEPGGPWLPHRLDLGTSGLVVVALTRRALRRFTRLFATRQVTRRYRARVHGRWETAAATGSDGPSPAVLDARLLTVPGRPTRVVIDENGCSALTLVRTLSVGEHSSEVAVEPVTGRRHQIRVHLAGAGHPIAGDPLYGTAPGVEGRMCLHAYEIEVPEPNGLRRVTSPVPAPWLAAPAVSPSG